MDLQKIVDSYFQERENRRVYLYERNTLDISDVGRCQRMRFLKFGGAKPAPYKPQDLRNFHMGNVVEGIYTTIWEVKGILRRFQQYIISRLDPKGRIKGKLDWVLVDGERFKVVELKSQKDIVYQKRIKKENPQPLNKRYGYQGLTYVDTLKQHLEESIDDELVIAEARRSDLSLHTTVIPYSKETFAPVEEDWKKMLSIIDAGKLPPVLDGFPTENWECKICPVKATCKQLYREEQGKKG